MRCREKGRAEERLGEMRIGEMRIGGEMRSIGER